FEEHLDWHGTAERYVADKLKIAAVSRRLLVNAAQHELLARTSGHRARSTFGPGAEWHVDAGFVCRQQQAVFDTATLRAPGAHNAGNACAALAAMEIVGLDAVACAPALASFQALPHRLQMLGERGGWAWINDSISTTPLATLAALESQHGRAVTVLVGGFDRGLDWTPFVDTARVAPPAAIVCMGANGARIAAALQGVRVTCPVVRVADLASAVAAAMGLAPPAGVILLSPGAPSFDQFRSYAERGRAFAECAGFDGGLIGDITGLGIA
ncbi:MAG: Mur ligase family protein, partial [Rhodanobacter sp.]